MCVCMCVLSVCVCVYVRARDCVCVCVHLLQSPQLSGGAGGLSAAERSVRGIDGAITSQVRDAVGASRDVIALVVAAV